MKKSLRTGIFLLLTTMLLTVSAFADSGPKSALAVKVEHAPEETYYLDLLAEGDYTGPTYGSMDTEYSGIDWSYSDEEAAALDSDLLDALRAAISEGWHACTAQGTNGAPMWGDLIGCDTDTAGERMHYFYYHGVPDTYRILIVTKSGESWVSDVCRRATLQSSATVDWAAKTVSVPSPGVAYALQFLCTLLPTLFIEGVLLAAFGYRSKRSWRSFLFVNLITQGGFAGYLAVTVLNHGVSGWSLLFYVPIEVVITVVELLLYRRLLTEKSRGRAMVYAVAANLCSATVGLLLIDPLWQFIVSIS